MDNLKGSNPKDVELENTIARALHGLASDLHVTALSGHITLTGKVDNFGAKRDIYLTAQSVAGVKVVSNQIMVTPIGD